MWDSAGGQEVTHATADVTSKTQPCLQAPWPPQQILSGHQILQVQHPETQYKPVTELRSQVPTKGSANDARVCAWKIVPGEPLLLP